MNISYQEFSRFLSDCVTSLARAYTERDTLWGVYLGQKDPTEQYMVFTPLLWECTAFLAYCLKIRKFDGGGPFAGEIGTIIDRLALDVTAEGVERNKFNDRIEQYIQGEDVMEMFGVFCNYASETTENAVAPLQARQEKNRYGNYAATIRKIGGEIFRKAYLGE